MKPLIAIAGVVFGGFLVMRGRRGGGFPFVGSRSQGKLSKQSVSADGAAREYALYVPPSAGPGSPLVVLLHGRGSGMNTPRKWGWEKVADANGLVLAYGQALRASDGRTTWNSNKGVGNPAYDRHQYSDVAYLDRVIDDVRQKLATRKTYVSGFSSGAKMTYRYAADRGDRIDGIAPMASTIGNTRGGDATLFAPPANVTASAILIHGGMDKWRGGANDDNTGELLPLADAVQLWKNALGATTPASVRPIGVPVEWHERWNNGRGQAVEVLVDKGRGHWIPTRWPMAEHVWRFWASNS